MINTSHYLPADIASQNCGGYKTNFMNRDLMWNGTGLCEDDFFLCGWFCSLCLILNRWVRIFLKWSTNPLLSQNLSRSVHSLQTWLQAVSEALSALSWSLSGREHFMNLLDTQKIQDQFSHSLHREELERHFGNTKDRIRLLRRIFLQSLILVAYGSSRVTANW